ncbi:hypothetical protein RHGRI_017733 [Rhododendron griersonianum]|uniref:Uncharacterized protein n=1 Tax=Rhododendron griersonianum TaxID=479676 RepID=A0AAV6JZ42_9ERIC|nr:hypothetical protein RHGRI_017733 [Rhododendron griersonianum]
MESFDDTYTNGDEIHASSRPFDDDDGYAGYDPGLAASQSYDFDLPASDETPPPVYAADHFGIDNSQSP